MPKEDAVILVRSQQGREADSGTDERSSREVRGQNVVVLGLARQGTALARWLAGQGARVTVSDVQPAEKLADAVQALDGLPIQYALGGHPPELLEGCDMLCLSGGVPVDLPIVAEARRRGIRLANDAQLFVERCPAPIVGITGSAGKTTTTTLVGEMGRAAGRQTWVGGNIGNPLVGDLESIAASDLVVMELSSFQLELMTNSPQVAAILNVTPNHLDRHPSMAAYIAAKARILDFQSAGDVAVLGFDDRVARSLARRVRGRLRLFARDWERFGNVRPHPSDDERLPGGADVEAAATVEDGRIVLKHVTESVAVCAVSDVQLRGHHNLLNVLAACALADAVGIPPDAMRRAIAGFRGVPHRLQLVREVGGVRYYDDSIATAPERLVAAVRSFHEPIVLLAGGRDKHLPWDEAAEWIVERVRQVVLFGEMGEMVKKVVEDRRSALGDSGALEGVHRVETLAQAVAKARQVARAGDVVLLAPGGTSFDAFKDFAERGDAFQELVRSL